VVIFHHTGCEHL